MMEDRLKIPFQEPRANSDSVDACPFCMCSLADMNASEYGDHLKRCLKQPATSTFGHNGFKKTTQIGRTEFPSTSDSQPSTSASVPQLHTCPCCEKVALPAAELDAHLQSCGIEVVSSATLSVSLSTGSSSIPSLFSEAEIASVTAKKEQRGPVRQTRITLKKLQKIDEETQVALALSASLMPQELPSRRPKKNPANSKIRFVQPAPILLERDPSESQKTLSDKVLSLIGVDRLFDKTGVLPESKVFDSDSFGDGIYSQNHKLWNLSREIENEELTRFYVSSLVPPISPKKMDDELHLKHLSQIPGFRLHLDASHQSLIKPTFSQLQSFTTQATTSSNGIEILEEESVHALIIQDSAPTHDTPVTLTDESTPNENNDEDDNHTLILGSSDDDDVAQLEDVEDCLTADDFKATVIAPNAEEGQFAALSDDQLNRKLEKFGVKPVGRAQAIAFLNAVGSLNTKKRAKPKLKKPRKRKKSANTLDGMTASTANLGDGISTVENEVPGVSTKDAKKGHKKQSSKRIQLVSSDDDSTDSVPCSSNASPKRPTKPVKLVTAEDVSTVLTQYIRQHGDLYEQLLQYQIVYLRPFLKRLKTDGYQINPQLVMDYFDHQSIGFSQHNEEKPRAWGGRKASKK